MLAAEISGGIKVFGGLRARGDHGPWDLKLQIKLLSFLIKVTKMKGSVKFEQWKDLKNEIYSLFRLLTRDAAPRFILGLKTCQYVQMQETLIMQSVIRQLAYGVNASFLDEYMQISERSSRLALDHFCQAVMEIYDPEFLRKPTYVRRDHGSNPFILLEVVASQDLWIWHDFFGVAGSNNDINVLYESPIFNYLKTGRALEIPFVANGLTYQSGYYLVDGIYPELAPLVKTIPEPTSGIYFVIKQMQDRQGKDVDTRFGVFLKKKWANNSNTTRALKKDWNC
ncbi:ALP1-like protein isoform X1 [Tanacetum coccineum]